MCVILDADARNEYCSTAPNEMTPLKKWIEGNKGRLVYSRTPRFEKEMEGNREMRRLLIRYLRSNRARLIDPELVEAERKAIAPQVKCNDDHIIALAMASRTCLLASHDKALHKDFRQLILKNREIGCSSSTAVSGIYQKASHKNLLTKRCGRGGC